MKLRLGSAAYAAVEPRVALIRQRLPLALVGLGVMLTGIWIILMCWVPFRLIVAGLQLALGDTFSAAFASTH
jgi:hypothetical protein